MWAQAGRTQGRPHAWVRAGGARLPGAGARALARGARRAAGPEPKRRRAEPSERLGLGRRLARQQRCGAQVDAESAGAGSGGPRRGADAREWRWLGWRAEAERRAGACGAAAGGCGAWERVALRAALEAGARPARVAAAPGRGAAAQEEEEQCRSEWSKCTARAAVTDSVRQRLRAGAHWLERGGRPTKVRQMRAHG
jgi:hypothetical protein